MELVDPPLPEDTKEKTITLVNIYAQELRFSNEENIPTDSQVYTVHNLKGKSEMVQNEEMDMAEDMINSQGKVLCPTTQSHWTRYKGNNTLTSIIKTNELMLFGDIITIYCEKHTEHLNLHPVGKSGVPYGMYVYRCD
jgi:hypothetical protein